MENENDILDAIYKIKTEKKKTLLRLKELNKLVFEYEMRFFLLSKKKEIMDQKVLKNIEKKIQKRFENKQ
jgi:hypothetical protein